MIDTEILYHGNDLEMNGEHPDSPCIYNATAYYMRSIDEYISTEENGGYLYNRSSNPNRDALGKLITRLEEGEASLLCSSGMAAIMTAFQSLLKSGDHVIMNRLCYGETIEVAEHFLKKNGVSVSYVDFNCSEEIERSIRDNTVFLYTEIISNPHTIITDIKAIVMIAKRHGLLTIVDNTLATPFVVQPLVHGVDIVIHSLTKYFGGHSDVSGGSITACQSIIDQMRLTHRLLGSPLDAYSSWLLARSIRTLALRVRVQNQNATTVASRLVDMPGVTKVFHPSLKDHPQHELAKRSFHKDMFGAIVSFHLDDDLNTINTFIGCLKMIKYLGTLGGIRTNITHPQTAFRNTLPDELKDQMGLDLGLVRLSLGVEHVQDILTDLEQAIIRSHGNNS